MTIRAIQPGDRPELVALLSRVENFSDDERMVALELIDDAIQRPASGYECIVAVESGRLSGYLCYGITPMTEWTYDLYWVATDPDVRGKGLGRALLVELERIVAHRGGKIIRIETSSQETYGETLEFYLRRGYAVASRIEDFYRAGDDLITLTKRLSASTQARGL
jgi:ribosomal protein S18 acetylase RimI-like enzyme